MTRKFTVGQAARRAQLTPRAVRLYEARGLLPVAPRSDAGYRLYTDEDLRLLRFIGQARALGLGLKDIQALIELRQDGGHPPGPDVLALIDAHLRDIDLAIANLQLLRNTLRGVFEQAKASVHHSGQAALCRILEHTAEPPGVDHDHDGHRCAAHARGEASRVKGEGLPGPTTASRPS
jgi:MerR family transcriptional regulator, copper efflux regulator